MSGHDIRSLAFGADGATLASAGLQVGLAVWDVAPRTWEQRVCASAGRNLSLAVWNRLLPDQEFSSMVPAGTSIPSLPSAHRE
jgi:hypothetical protein